MISKYNCDALSIDDLREVCVTGLTRGELWLPCVRAEAVDGRYFWRDVEDHMPEKHGPFESERAALLDAIDVEGVEDPSAWGIGMAVPPTETLGKLSGFLDEPILATLQPEGWTDGAPLDTPAVPLGWTRDVDVTGEVLAMSLEGIHALVDNDASTDDLIDPAEYGHTGPHHVRVVASVKAFFGVESLAQISQDQLRDARAHIGKVPDLLKLARTDRGNCRVYYGGGDTLYAYQLEDKGQFKLYECTPQGEPMYGVSAKPVDRKPGDYTEFDAWVEAAGLVATAGQSLGNAGAIAKAWSAECDVPDPEGMNAERASWARQALATFKAETRCGEEDAVADLMTNLMHHCDRAGLDFIAEMGRAVRNYEQETSSEFESAGLDSLDSLVSDAHELRDMKIEINGDYSVDDLRIWNDRIVLAEKTVELLKSVSLYPHLEQRAQNLLASKVAAPAANHEAIVAVSPSPDL